MHQKRGWDLSSTIPLTSGRVNTRPIHKAKPYRYGQANPELRPQFTEPTSDELEPYKTRKEYRYE